MANFLGHLVGQLPFHKCTGFPFWPIAQTPAAASLRIRSKDLQINYFEISTTGYVEVEAQKVIASFG